MRIYVNIAVEGTLDEVVLRRLIQKAGAELGNVYGQSGKSKILTSIKGYNAAAQIEPWLVLVDLDGGCAPELISTHLSNPAKYMRFRVAVFEVESWILADRNGLASFLGVSAAMMPADTETIPEPKEILLKIASRSRFRKIRESVTRHDVGAIEEGPGYQTLLSEFVANSWDLEVASIHSPSLSKCVVRLSELIAIAAQDQPSS